MVERNWTTFFRQGSHCLCPHHFENFDVLTWLNHWKKKRAAGSLLKMWEVHSIAVSEETMDLRIVPLVPQHLGAKICTLQAWAITRGATEKKAQRIIDLLNLWWMIALPYPPSPHLENA
jgi:hypothetical protein